jgi:hypothetical protein
MAIEVHPEPFKFVNYLRVKEWGDTHTLDVGYLNPKQSADYWDELKIAWIHHCDRRAKMLVEDRKVLASVSTSAGDSRR